MAMMTIKLLVCCLLVGIISAKPVESDAAEYRQLPHPGGSSYSSPILSGAYGATQGTYSGFPLGYAIPQQMQSIPLNSYLSPFGFQGFGGFGMPGYGGFPNFG